MKGLAFLLLLPFSLYAEECIENLGGSNICGANDFALTKEAINAPATCIAGEILPPITVRLHMIPTANQRFDIGFFSGDFGQSPIGGSSCTVDALVPVESGGNFNGISGSGPYRDLDGNSCGDVQKSDGEIIKDFVLDKVVCADSDHDGKLDIRYALTWQQQARPSCDPTNSADLNPPSASKCLATEGNLEEIIVFPPPEITSISVDKSASPAVAQAPGEDIEYTIHVENTGTRTVTVTAINDDKFGSIDSNGTCSLPQMLDPGETYSCFFSTFVSGDELNPHTNTLTAIAEDAIGNTVEDSDSEIVNFKVTATGFIGDAVFNDLNGDGVRQPGEPGIEGVLVDLFRASNPSTPTRSSISRSGGWYGFSALEAGDYIVDISRGQSALNGFVQTTFNIPLAVSIADAEDFRSADFGFAIAQVELVKTVDKSVIAAPGEDVTYTYAAKNTGAVMVIPVIFYDDKIGDLTQNGCTLPLKLSPTEQFSCSVTRHISGNPGESVQNVGLFAVRDAASNFHSTRDSAIVTIEDAGNAAIGHSVWHDQNGNGFFEAGEAGFNDVSLALGGGSIDTTQTLYGGSYAFLRLFAGDYNVSVTDSNGILNGYVRTNGTGPYDAALAAGQINLQANFGYGRASVAVSKSADKTVIHEPGESVTFTLTAMNNGEVPIDIVILDDTVFGEINSSNSNCDLPQTLEVNDSYSCTFTRDVTGSAGDIHSNSVTVTAQDAEGNTWVASDNENIGIIASIGGSGTIGYIVWNDQDRNGSIDAGESGIGGVTLDLFNDGGFVTSATTGPDGVYGFDVINGTYEVRVTDTAGVLTTMELVSGSNPHTGIEISDNIFIAANFGYATPLVRPTINVSKTASTDRVITSEDVVFAVGVTNTSPDDVTLTHLYDTHFGNLDGAGNCGVGGIIAPQQTYSCVFVETVSGNAGDIHKNTVIATVKDLFSQRTAGSDSWTITFGTASVAVDKSADKAVIYEPGEPVTFTFTVLNDGEAPLDITGLSDTLFGTIDENNSDCELPQHLEVNATYSCTITRDINGSAGTAHSNTINVTAVDANDNLYNANDSETVRIIASVGGFGDIGYLVWDDANRNGEVDPNESGIGGVSLDLLQDGGFISTTVTDLDGRYGFKVANGTNYAVQVTDTAAVLGAMELVSGSNPQTGIAIDNNIFIAANFGYAAPLQQPSVTVTKTGSTDSVTLNGDVTFTVDVQNTSTEDVVLTNLYDTVFGDLNGVGNCVTGVTIPAGGTYSCEFTQVLSGTGGQTHLNTVIATVSDPSSQSAIGEDSWLINFLGGFDDPVGIPLLTHEGRYLMAILFMLLGIFFSGFVMRRVRTR